MLDKAITEFLGNKKADFLKKKITTTTSDDKKITFKKEAIDRYSIYGWLNNAVKTANDYFTTHPAKFTHSTPFSKQSKFKAKELNVVFYQDFDADGLLKSGNVDVSIDLSGYPDNGNSTELYNFLKIVLSDGATVNHHLIKDTDYIKKQFKMANIDYKEIREALLPKTKNSTITSERLKQIYFPVDDDYHLLSLLTPSAIIYKLKQRINDNFQPFSNQNKETKESVEKAIKDKTEFKGKLESIWSLTAIGYGGANAQNVSVLNNQNGGVSFLLSSMPPVLKKRKVQPPKKDFFTTNIWLSDYLKEDFKYLNKVLIDIRNNKKIRDKRDEIILNIMTHIKKEIDRIRVIDSGWSNSETYSGLPKWQKILLDNKYKNIRDDKEQNQDFLDATRLEFSKWFSKIYNKLFDTNLGDIEITHIEGVIEDEMEVFK